MRLESDLYPAVKTFLQAQGYEVKGEIGGCDVVGTRAGEPPLIVELKLTFGLVLLLQGVDRLSLTDRVYLAVARPGRRTPGISVYRRDVRQLCRRVGVGLLTVAPGGDVEVVLDPVPYRPRVRRQRLARLLGEHARRAGDPTRGGVTRTPIMTAYRQEALRCAMLIDRGEGATLRALRETGLVPNASSILQRDVYGWFERVRRATYRVTARAKDHMARFSAAGTLPELPAAACPSGEPGSRGGASSSEGPPTAPTGASSHPSDASPGNGKVGPAMPALGRSRLRTGGALERRPLPDRL